MKALEESYLISLIKDLAYKGKDSQAIKNELKKLQNKYSEESLKLAIKQIDEYIVNYQLACQEKSKAFHQILMSLVLLIFGLTMTFYSYINEGSHYILPIGAIVSGAWYLINSLNIYKRPIESFFPRKKSFRKKFNPY